MAKKVSGRNQNCELDGILQFTDLDKDTQNSWKLHTM